MSKQNFFNSPDVNFLPLLCVTLYPRTWLEYGSKLEKDNMFWEICQSETQLGLILTQSKSYHIEYFSNQRGRRGQYHISAIQVP